MEQRVRLTGGGVALIAVPLTFLALFYLAPFTMMAIESVRPTGAESGWDATASHYERLVSSARLQRTLERTVWVSIASTVITLLLAYPLALYLVEVGRRLRATILLIVFVSLASSLLVRNYGWLVTLADAGPINRLLLAAGLVETPQRLVYNLGATIVALVHYALPFMVLPIYASLLRIPGSLREAARSLGANDWSVLRYIVLPLSMPGVFGGTVLAFAICMSAYVTPLMLGSPSTALISQIAAEQFMVQLNFPLGSAIIIALTMMILTILLLYSLAFKRVLRVDV